MIRTLVAALGFWVIAGMSAAADEPPKVFDLSCDQTSGPAVDHHPRYWFDMNTRLWCQTDCQISDFMPLQVTPDELVLLDKSEQSGNIISAHRVTVDRRTLILTNTVIFQSEYVSKNTSSSTWQCAIARYSGPGSTPLL
ncbi:MAG TPA: hypothetical protein VGG29_10700 [Caulobacteraceae bacterium]|jgi:hypothetical protein